MTDSLSIAWALHPPYRLFTNLARTVSGLRDGTVGKLRGAEASVSVTQRRGFVSDCESVAAMLGEVSNFAMSRTANPQEEIAALII